MIFLLNRCKAFFILNLMFMAKVSAELTSSVDGEHMQVQMCAVRRFGGKKINMKMCIYNNTYIAFYLIETNLILL